MTTRINGELLRQVADTVLRDIEHLISEGLDSRAVEKATTHALALTAKAVDLADHPERQRMHGVALWTLLSALTGPAAAGLLHTLDEALGSAP